MDIKNSSYEKGDTIMLNTLLATTILVIPCAPREVALEGHKQAGYERKAVELTADDHIKEKWQNMEGKTFAPITNPEGTLTCFVGRMPDEPRI